MSTRYEEEVTPQNYPLFVQEVRYQIKDGLVTRYKTEHLRIVGWVKRWYQDDDEEIAPFWDLAPLVVRAEPFAEIFEEKPDTETAQYEYSIRGED